MTRLDQPFLGQRAVAAGDVSARRLQKDFRAVYRNVYLPRGVDLDARTRARAAWPRAGGECTLVGRSAAAVLGAKWLDADHPAELHRADRHAPDGIVVRSYALAVEDVGVIRDMRTTTPARTAFDLGRLLPLRVDLGWRQWRVAVEYDGLQHWSNRR